MIPAPTPHSAVTDSAAQNPLQNRAYRDRLNPWCLVRLFPDLRWQPIRRFRKRNDAEAQMKILRQVEPGQYAIIFEIELEA